MSAHEVIESRSAASRVAGMLTWLGGGHRPELAERHERSTHAVAGAVVLFGALLAWLVASLAVSGSTSWPVPAIVTLTLVFGLLVGAVTRSIAGGPHRGWAGIAGRAGVALAVGAVVGELAALVVFSAPIERRLDERALRAAESSPAVAQASAALQQTRDARAALDNAVEQARLHQDQALVVARCEFNPTPACPQTRITGVPGAGPETRTANQLLADAQRELDNALAARDRQAPGLDAEISRGQQALAVARRHVVADAGRGLGARWVAMNDVTFVGAGALTLRLLTIGFFALLYLLPLILRLWRGESTQDRRASARAERERAELDADTAIAIKRAEVRREAEMLWAEHQLTQARLAIEAQAQIDREQQRRRVAEALDAPVRASARRTFEPVEEDMYLPIAAEAEAASRALTQLPAGAPEERTGDEPGREVEVHDERGAPLIPSIPDATRAAARWIRPLVPPIVARVIDNTTQPLRTARQVFEEVEEITFSLKRTRKVTVDSETSEASEISEPADEPSHPSRIHSSRAGRRHDESSHRAHHGVGRLSAGDDQDRSLAERDRGLELTERGGFREVRAPEGPRELPPPK
ncbi:DUF4407 domain-containing protein [Mycobacterium sp. 663a-19]|uniref:DUF4407 domain-containing protein n=1 Tax=Mycobacterium sp. 663a-19 TaxID=2986148 RepID=UPI002D1EF2B5|nr:DUF4407 domain-containing protein [Mycobacterium sp. 663a-19]MEB3981705.1 DUF4407 domain-containing protein [Mycobacterium sp. 663a-19]